MRAEDRHIKSITVCMSANYGSSHTMVAYDFNQRAQMKRFMRSTVELMQVQCCMYLAEASSYLSMRAEKRHIKSITVS